MNATEDIIEPGQRFDRRVPADIDELGALRRSFHQFITALGMSEDDRDDIVLATYEAMANAVEHAYRDNPSGYFTITTTCRDHVLTVTVTDHGTWKTPNPAENYRGRGLALINDLADTTDLHHRPDGTTITMTWAR